MPQRLLELRHVRRSIRDGQRRVLDDLSLEINAGSQIALLGPSGSGKSLLLKSIAQLEPIDHGEVLWQGRICPPREMPSFRAAVMYLPQQAVLFDGTVEDNLRRPFELKQYRHLKYSRASHLPMLRRWGRNESFLSQSGAVLSGGERQLVALLRALQLNPIILLCDEATAALDESVERDVEQVLIEWVAAAQDQRALVWASHDRAQVARLATDTWSLQDGHVVCATNDRSVGGRPSGA